MPSLPAESSWWRWVVVACLWGGVIIRSWPWLCEPLLPWEDGALFFARNYSEFSLASAGAAYAGYVPFGSNLLSILACRLPTSCIPTAFVIVAGMVLVGAAGAMLRSGWGAVAPFRTRCMMAAVVAWLPIGTYLELTTIAYVQWALLLWLFLLLLEPSGDRPSSSLGRNLAIVVLAMSHPLAALLLPLGLIATHRLERDSSRWAYFIVGLVAYWTMLFLSVDEQVSPSLGHGIQELLPVMGLRVGLEAVLGSGGREWVSGYGSYAPLVVASLIWLVMVGGVLAAWRKWSVQRKVFVIQCAWFCVATVAASLVARPDWSSDDVLVVRYVWPSRVAFCWVALLILRTWVPLGLSVAISLAFAWGLMLSNGAFHRHFGDAAQLRSFVDGLVEQEEELGGRRWVRAFLVREKGPSIVIKPQ